MDEKKSRPSTQVDGMGQRNHDVETLKAPLGARPACFSSTFIEILFVIICTFGVAMSGFLAGSIYVVSTAIAADLQMNQAEITWAIASSSLTAGAFLLFFGRFTDLFGRKVVFVTSLFLFAILSLAVGFSKDGIAFDAVNGLMGLTCASAIPPAVGILGSLYPQGCKRKNYVFACFSAGNPLGFVFGTISSGIAAQIFNWRASLWFLAIVYIVASIVAYFSTPPDNSDKLPLTRQTFQKFDVVGTLLTIAGVGLFTCALSLGGNAPQGWKTPYVLVLLILGVVLVTLFILWEIKYPYPLMPMRIWRDRDFSLLLIIMCIGVGNFTATLFWVTIYMQNFWTGSAIHVAAYTLPAVVSGVLANIFAGMLLHKIPGRWIMAASCVILSVAFTLFGCNRLHNTYWSFIFPGLAIITWAVDLQFNVVNMYIITSLPKEQQGVAGSIFQTIARIGMTVGFALTTAIHDAVDVPITGWYKGDVSVKWAACYWFGAGTSFLTLVMVPFLRVGTQGNGRPNDAGDPEKDRNRGSV